MGFDLAEWRPNGQGGFAEWQYHWHSTLNSNFISRILAGTTDYSTPPTLAEINDHSVLFHHTGLNQVIALLNYRIAICNTNNGTTLPPFDYFDPDGRIFASDLQDLEDAINDLRVTEGFSLFTFTAPTIDKKILEIVVIELRKSLAITGVMTISARLGTVRIPNVYYRNDDPYLTPGNPVAPADLEGYIQPSGPGLDGQCGKSMGAAFSNTWIQRFRLLASFPIPEWVSDADTVEYFYNTNSLLNNMEAFTLYLYSSNTDDSVPTLVPAFGGSAYNLDNLEGNTSVAPSTQSTIPVDLTRFVGHAGFNMSFISGQFFELAGTGSGTGIGSVPYGSDALFDSHGLTIDFGAYPTP